MLETIRSPEESKEWLGSGEMAERIRRFDWSQTPLGPAEDWSAALRTTVGLMAANRFPQLLWWGPDYISLYNDSYIPVLGLKHPDALGLPVRECWSEIWDVLKPLIDTPFQGGPATWIEDLDLVLQRSGFVEEAHFTVSYSPVPDMKAASGIGGVLVTVLEISKKIVAERRVALLRDLGLFGAESSVEEHCRTAAATLARYGKDVPFALLYLADADGKHARLAAAAGAEPGTDAAPQTIGLEPSAGQGWPLAAAFRGQGPVEVGGLASRFGSVPPGPWVEPPHTALILPLRSGNADPFGFLVCGISSRLEFDADYKSFCQLAANQVAMSLAHARAYQEERKRAEALAEIDRVKTAFFSNVSHEFRTPLTLMLGPLEALRRDLDGQAQQRQVELIERNGQRLLKLVNTLLDFSRIEAGRTRAVFEPMEIASFTAELASLFRSAAEGAGLRLEIDCPPMSEPAYVDRDMWEKIVLNLISNAFKFTFEGGITVKLRSTGTHFELTVRDTGTGIPDAELPKLFERFHRVAGARGRTHEGSGIGLALVQEFARLHGGEVEAESVYGEGSAFRVLIPRGAAHLPLAQLGPAGPRKTPAIVAQPFVEEALRWLAAPADDRPGPETDGETADRPRILLVDDNADMRDYVGRLLATRYEVRTAEDGEQALAAIEDHLPDLVLSDIMMPRLDGLGLLARLRSNPRTTALPVILLSARAGEEALVEGLDTGADDYLIKPFTTRELMARVAATLETARIRRDAVDAAQASEARLAAVLEQIPLGIGMIDLDRRIVLCNPAMRRFMPEGSPLVPDPWPVARALKGETLMPGLEMPFAGEGGREIWAEVSAAPMRNCGDAVVGAILVVQDIEERKKAEATQALLMGELNHRIKNTLASVQAIAQQMLRRTRDPGEFAESFSGRIRALARVHEMLTSATWQGLELSDLIRDQLLAGTIDETRISLRGPKVELDAQMALHVALMLHELATNAIKYGALSGAKGKVAIIWSVQGERLRLRWEELGRPVPFPSKRGFGTTLIEQSAKGEGGEALMSAGAKGVVWDVTLPLGDDRPLPVAEPVRLAPEEIVLPRQVAPLRLAGKRVLVVEDEPLVALLVVDALQDAGAEVLGSVGTAREALSIIGSNSLDAALLDANLHGNPVDDIAAALTARNIPFLFVTGYGRGSLPKDYAKAAILTKPFGQEQFMAAVSSLVDEPKPYVLESRDADRMGTA